MKLAGLTSLALLAFAANSVLTRGALSDGRMDAMLFASIRVAAGTATLLALLFMSRSVRSEKAQLRPPDRIATLGSWPGAVCLFLYVVPFSLAYLSLSTGTGALILFGFVHLTMIFAGYRAGERPRVVKWMGMLLAASGLVVLVLPGVSAPPWGGALLMAAAGVSWGLYSLLGRRVSDPLRATAGNMLRALPATLLVTLLVLLTKSPQSIPVTNTGTIYAALSGALMSGAGYAVWYAVLPGLRATTAATLQLTVPMLAALGGLLFVAEPISLRLLAASLMILGGALAAILAGNQERHST